MEENAATRRKDTKHHYGVNLCMSILNEYPEIANPMINSSFNEWNLKLIKGIAMYFFQSNRNILNSTKMMSNRLTNMKISYYKHYILIVNMLY